MHLVNSMGNSPSPGQPTPGVVKQDKSFRGCVDTTKTRLGPQRVKKSSGERPIGTAKGKQPNTEALCQIPPPLRTAKPLGPYRQGTLRPFCIVPCRPPLGFMKYGCARTEGPPPGRQRAIQLRVTQGLARRDPST